MCTAVTFSHWLGWCNIQYGRLEGATSQFPFWPNHLPETSTTNLTKHQTDDHASTCKPTKLFIYHDFLGEFFNALFTLWGGGSLTAVYLRNPPFEVIFQTDIAYPNAITFSWGAKHHLADWIGNWSLKQQSNYKSNLCIRHSLKFF